jgi:3-phenylpropionate/trans-cinnamate dioxygenase ferredoxin reductase component
VSRDAPGTVVVVGAGLAGGTAAATLREEGFEGRLLLIGAEELPPYERPPLSKEVLRGERDLASTFVRPSGWWDEHGIETRLGVRVERLETSPREVVLDGGERIAFDRAVVATGVRSRSLGVPGEQLDGVLRLRTPGDTDRIREAAAAGGRAVLVGMGFVGAEVAASLRMLGVDVTIVEVAETALVRALGIEIGRTVEGLHRDHGVEMVLRDAVERFEGADRLERVVTTGGRTIECSFVVVGVGVDPVAGVVRGAGIGADGGVEVDASLETAIPGVFAAGDVASHDHPVFGSIRVEHFDNAWKMGEAAAHNIMGRGRVFDDPHWFWSDQFDASIEMAGYAPTWDRMVVRGSLADRRYCAFLLRDARVRAAVSMDWPRDVRRSFELIRTQVPVEEEMVADADVDLRTLVPARKGA